MNFIERYERNEISYEIFARNVTQEELLNHESENPHIIQYEKNEISMKQLWIKVQTGDVSIKELMIETIKMSRRCSNGNIIFTTSHKLI